MNINLFMNSKSRQKAIKCNNEPKLKNVEQSQGFDSCSTLENNPTIQFSRLKTTVHNLFELAKTELSGIYQFVINQLNSLGSSINNKKSDRQNILQHIIQVRRQAQLSMVQLPSKLINLLTIPKLIRPEINAHIQQLMKQKIKQKADKKKVTYNSSNNLQISLNQLNLNNRNAVKKITTINVKNFNNLDFLESAWPILESINLQGKAISNLCSFQYVIATNLQSINLSNNEIHDVQAFRKCQFPSLTSLNLSKNKIKIIQGIQQSYLPQLKILNLSNNLISKIGPLSNCRFPELLELNLEGNKLQNVEVLNRCQFSNLQILNLDSNRFVSLDSLKDCPLSRLKVLSFSHNLISSLQFIQKISLRRLHALIGHNNKITSLEPLSNKEMPLLSEIVLHGNQISDLTCVSRMNFPLLTGFDLQFNKIQPKTYGCFFVSDKGFREAISKYPFLLI